MLSNRGLAITLSAVFVLVAIGRIWSSYAHTAQTFDEPCHVAAGIEFLDKKTYSLDPVHPPLSRIAIALPLHFAGERYPNLPPDDPQSHNYNVVGNHILYDSGHIRRNLLLARIGVLPFFLLGAIVVFLWALHIAGQRSAILAVLLYTTTPTILAFSSIAYTDIVAASTQLAALFAFSLCLEKRSLRRTLLFGFTLGLALLAKLTSVMFLPAAGFLMFLLWTVKGPGVKRADLVRNGLHWVGALGVAVLILWGGYRFSVKPIQEVTGITPSSMPSFQHFPAFARPILPRLIRANPRLPAPELLSGVAQAWVLNKSAAPSYLFGQVRVGGWWYFYLCALAVKLPLPILIAFGIGIVLLFKGSRNVSELLPLAALIGVLLVTMHVSYQVGLRHILVGLLLIAIIAAAGLKPWIERMSWKSATTITLIILAGLLVIENIRAQADFLAYFNELAGSDPSWVLSTGCDFDCGQDVYVLSQELQKRHVTHVTLAVWSSADMGQLGLPPFDLPSEQGRAQGWVAVSSRALRVGDYLHYSVSPHTFDWLHGYSPTTNVGETIKLYFIDSAASHVGAGQ